ncbi:MAG: substrate-binding domain-containing protein [Candidatus Omnitrophica bacterium]|nr:substrate-binding domain-containing protein [Candidatus Omnitrophota bacterium]
MLYRRVKEYLIAEIEKNKEGSALPSQSFLMKKFDVCHLTVRKALAELEKEGLIIKKQGKGTFVRKKIPILSSIKILIVTPFNWKTDFYSSFPFMEKLIDEAIERYIQIQIFPFRGDRYEIIRAIDSEKFNGVIWLMPWEKDLPLMEEIFEMGCHVMAINRIFSDSKFNYISTDHEDGGYSGTRYLINKGHRKIAFVGYIEASHIIQRYCGFCRAVIEAGLNPNESGIVRAFIEESESWAGPLEKDFEKMLSSYQPTAIFVSGISILLNGVLPVLREKQVRIPQDLEVITYDEIPEDIPEKAAIHELSQPFCEMGKISIEKMEGIIRGIYESARIALKPELLIKNTDRIVMTSVYKKR